MLVSLTIIRYRTIGIPLGFLSMPFFHIYFFLRRKSSFYKLMGCGKNGTFDIVPDLHQWAIMATHDATKASTQPSVKNLYGSLIHIWIQLFAKEQFTLILLPMSGHGKWDGKEPFQSNQHQSTETTLVGTLTRATIRYNKLRSFWNAVPAVSAQISKAKGFRFSVGIGEIPWIKQATFSIWDSEEDLKQFAYRSSEHSEVIKNTRNQDWYSEELFFRFQVKTCFGTLNGKPPISEFDR
jgi:hypothetical protein